MADPTDVDVLVQPPPPSIYECLGRIVAELPAIGKNSVNTEQGFNFRGIDDVLNALSPLLGKYGVFYVPDVIERVVEKRTTRNGGTMYEVNLHVRYTFYGPAGDSVSASGWGEGTDMGDKATNKAMTGAMKYVLFQTFAIATKEQSETDADRGGAEETVPPPPPPDPAVEELKAFMASVRDMDDATRARMNTWWQERDQTWTAADLLDDGRLVLAAALAHGPEEPTLPTGDDLAVSEETAAERRDAGVCVGCGKPFAKTGKHAPDDASPEYGKDCAPF